MSALEDGYQMYLTENYQQQVRVCAGARVKVWRSLQRWAMRWPGGRRNLFMHE